jgi:hypothetical protein
MKREGIRGIVKRQRSQLLDFAKRAIGLERRTGFKLAEALNRSARAISTCLVLLIALTLGNPGRATGSTVIETLTGTLYSSTDVSGMFVGKNAAMSGLPFKIVYILDTNGGKDYYSFNTPCNTGRINAGLNTPIPKAVLTINAKDLHLWGIAARLDLFVGYVWERYVSKNHLQYLHERKFPLRQPSRYVWVRLYLCGDKSR